MNFKISKRSFYNALSAVSHAISANSPIPALSGIKIDVAEDHLILTASDSNISIKRELYKSEDCELIVFEQGSVVIESRYILEIVRKIDSDLIQLELMDGALTRISGSLAEFNINGIPADQFPLIDFSKQNTEFTIEASALLKLISETIFATSDKETRPVLTGVNFRFDENTLTCIATDSYRLAKSTVSFDGDPLHFNVTIPSKSLNEVAKSLDGEEEVVISVSDKKVQFFLNQSLIQTRLIDGLYPETDRLIPLEFAYEFSIDSHDLLNAIDRASFIKSDGISVVKLEASSEEIVISSKSQEVGSSFEKINPIDYKGGQFSISFSGKYVYEAIRSLNSSTVQLKFSGPMKPFLILNPNDDTVLQLVLPVRTYN